MKPVSTYCFHCHLLIAPYAPRVQYMDFVFHGHCLPLYIQSLLDWKSAEFDKGDK